MKAVIALCVLFVGAYCAPMLDEQLGAQWTLFKNVHGKQYSSVEEEAARYVLYYFYFASLFFKSYLFFSISSRSIWEANVAKIQKHNIEADLGLHTYTLGMNRFGDMVSGFVFYHYISK